MKVTGLGIALKIFLLVSVVVLIGCQPNNEATEAALPPVVRILEVDAQSTAAERYFPARLEASQAANLSFQVAGQLVHFPVIKGDQIAKGELIARIDQTDYALNVEAAKVAFEQTTLDLQRLQQLRNQNHVSQAQFDEAKTARDRAEVELDRARQHFIYTEIFAPFDAVIADRTVENFSQVAAGMPIVRIHDLSRIEVEIAVPEILLPQVQDPADFNVTATLPSVPDRAFELTFKEFATEPDPRSRTYRVTFDMENPEDLRLLPGMSATVRIALLDEDNALPVLPLQAVVGEGDEAIVYVYNQETQRVETRPVTIGRLTGQGIEILSGLETGEQIVAAGVGFLSDGMQVRPDLSLRESH